MPNAPIPTGRRGLQYRFADGYSIGNEIVSSRRLTRIPDRTAMEAYDPRHQQIIERLLGEDAVEAVTPFGTYIVVHYKDPIPVTKLSTYRPHQTTLKLLADVVGADVEIFVR